MKIKAIILGVSAVLAVSGCAKESKPEEFFPAESTMTVLDVQLARGARADGTLYRDHFDGSSLNGLGREKLAMMLQDSEMGMPVVVYTDLRNDAMAEARRAAVQKHLIDAGVAAGQIKVEAGPNPETFSQASGHLSRMAKAESPQAQGGTAAVAEEPPAAK